MKRLLLGWLLITASAFAQTTCLEQDTNIKAPAQVWSGSQEHTSGAHTQLYQWDSICNYTRPGTGTDSGTCNVVQTTYAINNGTSDGGTVVGAPTAYHNEIFKSQQFQAVGHEAGTAPATVTAGTAVQACSHVSGCGAVTVNVPPFSATGGNVFETGDYTYSDYCPAKQYSGGRQCQCTKDCGSCGSPLMVDIAETGGTNIWQLTSVKHGILFDLKNTGKPQRIAWTEPGGTFAVLVLPDANGEIKNSNQLFGNVTPQPKVFKCGTDHKQLCPKNGFAALAVYDSPAKGGNGNGLIDRNDAIYYKLRLLLGKPDDPNHRLLTLQEANIESIDLKWQPTSDFADSFGNAYRFQSVVTTIPIAGNKFPTKRWMYDVWLRDESLGDIGDPDFKAHP
jgi:hypothetical protein